MLPAVVINIVDLAAHNPDYLLTSNDVVAWENNCGQIPRGVLVLLHTGWQQKWENQDKFMKQQHLPGFARETTKF